MTTTDRPRSVSSKAQSRPASPAPITHTSTERFFGSARSSATTPAVLEACQGERWSVMPAPLQGVGRNDNGTLQAVYDVDLDCVDRGACFADELAEESLMAKQSANAQKRTATASDAKSQNDDPAQSGGVSLAGRAQGDAEEDHVYGLASVLYHALQGVTAARQYKEDARRAGVEDLVEFFEECQSEAAARAKQAKSLLIAFADETDSEDDSDAENESEDA